MRIAYFINQYPKVSHSFIRREIIELENQGVEVMRYSIKRDGSDIVDPGDRAELNKTTYIAEFGKIGILTSIGVLLLASPIRWFRAMIMAVEIGLRSHSGIVKHLIYFVEACILVDDLKKSEIRHVHAHFGTNPATVVLLAKILGGITYSFTVHGPEEFDKPEALSLGKKIEHASFVAAISSFGRSQLLRWCDHDQWQKIQIVHCALDSDFLHAGLVPVPDNHRLVCVGRLCEQKGQLLLVEAIYRLKKEGVSVELVLAGDGPMCEEIKQLVDCYGLSTQVSITGWISASQVLEEIVASRALVLPSFAEGLPVVLMEACALRRPVVTTYIAGIPELVKNGVNGWLVPSGSVELLQSALKEVLLAPLESLDKMGEEAYRAVSERHDICIECAHLKSLFQQVLE